MVLTAQNQVHTLTVGAYTLVDSENNNGTGCSGMLLHSNKGSTGASNVNTILAIGPNGAFANPPGASGINTAPNFVAPLGATPTNSAEGTGQGNVLFQAVLEDGSSFATGDVGDTNGKASLSGFQPCIDVGGVSGS